MFFVKSLIQPSERKPILFIKVLVFNMVIFKQGVLPTSFKYKKTNYVHVIYVF